MAQNQKQKSWSDHQFIKSQFLKRTFTKLILSVSVLFPLVFSHSTLQSFVHYFNFYFSTLPFKLLSHTLDKNFTFLLCNGILVVLAKYSGLFSLSSSQSSNKFNLTESFKNYEDDLQLHPQVTIMETTAHHHQVPLLEQEAELGNTQTHQNQNAMQQENENQKSEEEKTETEMFTEETHEEQEEKGAVALGEDASEAEAESSFFIEEVDDDEEEDGGGGNGKLSNEELNKKFDDFIRKMKEELRIEARQQLIIV